MNVPKIASSESSIIGCMLSRIAEVIFGGVILYLIIDPISSDNVAKEIIFSIYLCLIFQLISGYIATSSFVYLYMVDLRGHRRGAVLTGLFMIHAVAFMVLFWPFGLVNAVVLLLAGSFLVWLSAIAGQRFPACATKARP